jgi:DNA-binding transcriptional LysR family regulator
LPRLGRFRRLEIVWKTIQFPPRPRRCKHRDVNTLALPNRDISRAYWVRARARRDPDHRLVRPDMLTIAAAVIVGILIGELITGIPLSHRIARYEHEHRKPTPFPDVGDLGETIIAEWPEDRSAAMLETWRTERARRDLDAMRRAADADLSQAVQTVSKQADLYRVTINWQRPISVTRVGAAH